MLERGAVHSRSPPENILTKKDKKMKKGIDIFKSLLYNSEAVWDTNLLL